MPDPFDSPDGQTDCQSPHAVPASIQGVRVTYTTTSAGPGADVHVQCRAELDALRAANGELTAQVDAFNAVMPWPQAVGMYYRVLGERDAALRERDEGRAELAQVKSVLRTSTANLNRATGIIDRAALAEAAIEKTWRPEVSALRARLAQTEAALRRIQQWDMLNPPEPRSDFPWLKRLVDDALAALPEAPPAP